MSAPAARNKFMMPTLTRSTAWSAEKISALSLAEIRTLSTNADRLGEEEVVAMCKEAISQRAKKQSALRKTAVKKPGVKVVKAVKAAA